MNGNNYNSNVTITVFANERVFTYPVQLNKTLEIQTTDITNGSNANTTLFVMYSMPTTGTSENSTAISLAGDGLVSYLTLSTGYHFVHRLE